MRVGARVLARTKLVARACQLGYSNVPASGNSSEGENVEAGLGWNKIGGSVVRKWMAGVMTEGESSSTLDDVKPRRIEGPLPVSGNRRLYCSCT
jgi:hypothetical protein